MGRRVEGQASAVPWARTPIGASGILKLVTVTQHTRLLGLWKCLFRFWMKISLCWIWSELAKNWKNKKWQKIMVMLLFHTHNALYCLVLVCWKGLFVHSACSGVGAWKGYFCWHYPKVINACITIFIGSTLPLYTTMCVHKHKLLQH